MKKRFCQCILILKRFLSNFDFPLFFTYLVLCLFGLVMIYSASHGWAVDRYEAGNQITFFGNKF